MAGHTPVARYAKPAGCAGCSLESIGFGFAPAVGPDYAMLLFIGEALGFEEALAGEPFYGAAGGVLSRVLHRCGIDRRQVRIANIVSCRPPQDYLAGAPWEQHAVAMCRQYLQPIINALPAGGVIVTLGSTALDAVLRLSGVAGVTVKDFHGTVHEIERVGGGKHFVVPTYHPSHLQRGAMNLLEIVCSDIRLADRISQKGFTRSQTQLVIDPPIEWFTQWCQAHLARIDQDVDGVHLSLDCEFLEKAGGVDEGEVLEWNAQSPMTRINGGNDAVTGWTVPAVGDYLRTFQLFLEACARRGAWAWFWNKYADLDHFQAAGMRFDGLMAMDGMWLWKHIQTDVPRGLGFVAPMASDFGAWKHWGKDPLREGPYAAADGVQNWRTCMWVMKAAHDLGQWDMFMRDWHDRDQYCLRPAHLMGVPIDRVALEAFHKELQEKLANVLVRLKETAARGVLKPKAGYAKVPMVKCVPCAGSGYAPVDPTAAMSSEFNLRADCLACGGAGKVQQTTPPASILGKSKKGGGEAKQQYMIEGVRLVQAEIDVEILICDTCHATDVGRKHKCPVRKTPRRKRGAVVDGGVGGGGSESPVGGGELAAVPPVAQVVTATARRTRYFWQLPFNPDAPAQILAYFAQQGIEAPVDKKTQRATTNKKALETLRAQHRDDPFFQLQMDWKAVQKVDATYAVGTLKLLDADDRVHPEYLPIPSTLRDSARHPNLTNVVADKSGVQGLAAGFRRCIVARDGVPTIITPEEYAAWEQRWLA